MFIGNINKVFFINLGLILITSGLYAQYHNPDSLEQVLLRDDLTDEHRLNVLSDLCWEYLVTGNPKNHVIIREINTLNTKLNGSEKSYKIENLLGLYNKKRGDFDQALFHFQESLKISEKEKDTLHTIWALYRLGDLTNYAYNQVKHKRSNYTYYNRALEYLERYENLKLSIFVNNGMAVALINDGRYKEALNYLNVTNTLFAKRDFIGKDQCMGFYYNQLGNVSLKLKNFEEAELNVFKAIEISEDKNIQDLKVSSYYYMGEILSEQKKWREAESYYLKRLDIQANRNIILKTDAYKDLLYFYIKSQNSTKINEYLPNFLKMQDSVITQLNNDKYAEFEVQFEVKEKDFQNEILKQQNIFKNKKLTLFQIAGIGGGIFLSLILGLLFRLRSNSKLLIKSNEYKDKILNIMGHDIRSPLITQLSLVQHELEKIPQNNRGALSEIYELSLSIYKISDNVYNWVKKNRGVGNDFFSDCQLYYEILLVLEQYEPVLKVKQLILFHNYETIKDYLVKGDRLGIQAVIRNLVDNATKYSPNQGSIYFELSQDDHNIYLSMSNECLIEHNNSSKGKGLGLQLVKEILEFNYGEVLYLGNKNNTYISKIRFTISK